MSSIVNDEFVVKVGSRGDKSSGSSDWDEAGYGSVRQIFITHGAAINSFQVLYDVKGTVALAHRHGRDGDHFDSVVLQPNEYFTAISGHYDSIDGHGSVVVRSLTFYTSRTNFGPFGEEEGVYFCFNLQPKLEFRGFHGRSSESYLCAIGIYFKCSNLTCHFGPLPPKLSTPPLFYASGNPLVYTSEYPLAYGKLNPNHP